MYTMINHISPKGRPWCYAKSPTALDCFSQFQASSAGWGDL